MMPVEEIMPVGTIVPKGGGHDTQSINDACRNIPEVEMIPIEAMLILGKIVLMKEMMPKGATMPGNEAVFSHDC